VPRLLALLAFRDELRFLPGFFANVAPHVDGIVALDDGSRDASAELVAAQPSVVELLRVAPGVHADNEDGRLRRTLIEASWRHGPDWLLGLDADERLEREFRARADAEIARADHDGEPALLVPFRELWDRPDRMRVDGVWGRKAKACLFRADRTHGFDERRIHTHWASVPMPEGGWREADLLLYHLRMVWPADRAVRRARYERIDPDRRWQRIGYEYLTDEEGIELVPLPPGRGFAPPGAPPPTA
jgi:hypothetical protein